MRRSSPGTRSTSGRHDVPPSPQPLSSLLRPPPDLLLGIPRVLKAVGKTRDKLKEIQKANEAEEAAAAAAAKAQQPPASPVSAAQQGQPQQQASSPQRPAAPSTAKAVSPQSAAAAGNDGLDKYKRYCEVRAHVFPPCALFSAWSLWPLTALTLPRHALTRVRVRIPAACFLLRVAAAGKDCGRKPSAGPGIPRRRAAPRHRSAC